MPYSAAASRPSRNGKKASEAITAPCDLEAFVAGLHRRDARSRRRGSSGRRRRRWSCRPREHDGVRLDVLAHPPGEQQVVELGVGGRALRDDLQVRSRVTMPVSRSCTSRPPVTLRISSCGVARRERRRCSSSAHVLLGGDTLRAPRRSSAARRSPRRTAARRSLRAVAPSSGRLNAMMPPNAEVGSVR